MIQFHRSPFHIRAAKVAGVFVLGIVCACGCLGWMLTVFSDIERKVILQKPSPDGKLILTVTEVSGNATVSTAHIYSLSDSQEKVSREFLRVDHVGGDQPVYRWEELGIEVTLPPDARVFRQESSVDVGGRIVAVSVRTKN